MPSYKVIIDLDLKKVSGPAIDDLQEELYYKIDDLNPDAFEFDKTEYEVVNWTISEVILVMNPKR